MPARLPHADCGYDIYPAHDIGPERIIIGHAQIAGALANYATITLDGYAGVAWQEFRRQLTGAWNSQGIVSEWIDVTQALRPASQLQALTGPYTGGDDPIFGTAFTGDLSDFFDADKLGGLKPSGNADVALVFGCGAALACWDGALVYLEVPKNEIQFRARAGSATNLGVACLESPRAAYKRNYFIDWPVLNRHKEKLLPGIDLLIDEQRSADPTAIRGTDLRQALDELTRVPLRTRPWFEPGAWGGQWMKRHIPRLPQDVPNYAWSFELISPENGLVLESSGISLEISFDTLLFHDARAVLGESASRFGAEFPIRFDFLDTFDGGNLSVQVHPRPEYIRANFGERFTQDEAYYILDCRPGAEVYLGFRADIDPDQFRTVLDDSAQTGRPIDVKRFVQTHPARRHDLFLIPHGTIHCSGVDNLVLEISATPYIFTFKLYDWVRPDLDGKLRPLNIERGMANLDFERKGDLLGSEHISCPELIAEGPDWRLIHLPTHPDHFYDVRRIELDAGEFELPTADSVQVMSLVEGDHVVVEAGGRRTRYGFAETFIVPAAAERVRFHAERPVKVVTANVKPGRGPL
jgi:mannose-6-phosphate isomerase class I